MNTFILDDRYDAYEDRETVTVPHPRGADAAVHVLVVWADDDDHDEYEFDVLHPPVCGYVDTLTADGSAVEYREYSCLHEAVGMDWWDDDLPEPGLYESRAWHEVNYWGEHSLDIEVLREISPEQVAQ